MIPQILHQIDELWRAIRRLQAMTGVGGGGGGGGGTASNTVSDGTTFGNIADAGTSFTYSRGDHDHGTPPDPIPGHVAAGDPHTQYQRESEKGVAGGYAGLGAGGFVPTAQLGSGVADATTFLRGDQSWAVPAGGGSGTRAFAFFIS